MSDQINLQEKAVEQLDKVAIPGSGVVTQSGTRESSDIEE